MIDQKVKESIKEKKEQLRFILDLSDKIGELSNPSEIFAIITKETKRYFDASICGYHEVKDNRVIKNKYVSTENFLYAPEKCEWCKYGELRRMLREGKVVIVKNVPKSKLVDREFKDWCSSMGIESSIFMPIIKDGNLIGIFFIDKEGPYHWTMSDIELIKDISGRTWMAVERAKDKKDKELLLSQVIEKQERLERIIENMDVSVWTSDTLGNISLLNSPEPEVLGGDEREKFIDDALEKIEISEVDGTPIKKEDLPLLKALRGERVKGEEIVRHPKTKELRYRLYRISPLRNENGNITGAVGITQDITERKEMEESLKTSREKGLELIKRLRKTDKARNLFLSSLSHELRNPLATLMMGINLLQEEGQAEEIKENTIKMMARQGKQLSRLVDDLLDMTRITQNKFNLKFEKIEITSLVKNIIADSSTHMKEKGIRQEIDILEEEIHIKGDLARLTQSIENLIHNASKFTPKYGTISISMEKDHREREVVISIKDTGEGISPKLLDDIFEPFVQVKNNLGKSYAGLGIGLAIVKDIITKHNGDIEVFSKGKGWGTEFIITLPILKNKGDEKNDTNNR